VAIHFGGCTGRGTIEVFMFDVFWWVFWVTAAIWAYAHFGYALLMAAWGRRRRDPVTENGELPCVTLIIPAHNEETVLQEKLENVLRIDYPRDRLEILVASDGSVDRTLEIARGFESHGVTLLDMNPRRGKASALNDAVKTARHDVLCLCDANVMFRPDALKILVSRLDDPQVGAVSGEVHLASHESNFEHGEGLYYQLERRIQEAESSRGSLMGVDGGMYVLRRPLFRPLPPDTILDDFVISMRVIQQRHRVVYEPDACATENGTPLAMQEYRRRVRVSAGAVQSLKRGEYPPLSRPIECWQFVSHKLLRWLGPVWLIVLLVSNAALLRGGLLYQALFAAQIAVYAIAAVAALSLTVRTTRIGGIVFYFVMSQVAITWGLIKGLLNRQKVTWNKADRSQSSHPMGAPAAD
jgi:cellulose synthase/poly-beta-1,6-N-acetylglucosamine synthase-like glycosyltransferase